MLKNTLKKIKPVIKTEGNNLYFYGIINRNNVLALTSHIRELNNNNKVTHINIHMGSNGGDLQYGFLGYDLLKQSKKTINTFCEGSVMSSATLIYLAGQNRFITPHSTMLIHQLSGSFNGTYEDIKSVVAGYDSSMSCVKNIYMAETNINNETLEFLLKRNDTLSAIQCVQYGFVHEIK